jgi:hypothetical protein
MQVEANGLKSGEIVHISLQLPSSRIRIDTFGRVVWIKQDRQGIQFTKMTNQNQEKIQRFITQVEKP